LQEILGGGFGCGVGGEIGEAIRFEGGLEGDGEVGGEFEGCSAAEFGFEVEEGVTIDLLIVVGIDVTCEVTFCELFGLMAKGEGDVAEGNGRGSGIVKG
jgi:hypothetical protein